MSVSSVTDFVEELVRLHVLTAPQQAELQTQLAPRLADAKKVAAELIRRGWLTPFQANLILPGRTAELLLGPYVLMQRIGAGGMGQVYKALHTVLRRVDAVKVLQTGAHRPGESLPRFLQEAVAAGKVAHRNLVSIYTAERAGETLFLAMEYIDGQDLGRVLGGYPGGLPVGHACDFVRQTALGLQHAHERGLVHRDIKPSNLMLCSDGVVKVLDLGLARIQDADQPSTRLTRPGAVMGTPDYMSPEQINSVQDVDARSDIYSLGCTFYQLLTGSLPYPDGTMMEKLRRHCEGAPIAVRARRPAVPGGVDSVVQRMMARAPADRFQTAGEVAQVLLPFCQSGPVPTGPTTTPASIAYGQEAADANVPTHSYTPVAESISDVAPALPQRGEEQAKRRGISRKVVLAAGGGLLALVLVLVAVRLIGEKSGEGEEKPGDGKPPEDDKPTLVVDTQGDGLRTIHEAVSQAKEGSRIRIKPGVYAESLNLHKNLELVGTGPDVIIEGTESECVVSSAAEVILRGLTLRGRTGPGNKHFAVEAALGHVLLEDCTLSSDSMACISVHGDAGLRATLRNCTIRAGITQGVIVHQSAEALLEGCDIQGKSKPGVQAQDNAVVTCRDCKIHEGEGTSVVGLDDARLTMEKCEVWGNLGTGVHILDRSVVKLTGCTIRDNKLYGVWITENRGAVLEDCDIHNCAKSGVRLTRGARPKLKNCRLHGSDVGLYCDKDAGGTLEDCKLWDHKNTEVYILDGGNPTLLRCTIRNSRSYGVTSTQKGAGLLVECDLFGHKGSCAVAVEGAKLTLKKCKLRDGQEVGVKVQDGGHALLEECEVYGHVKSGLAALREGKATVRGGKIVRNGYYGVTALENTEVSVEGCDLRANFSGPWDIAPSAKVTRSKNRE